MQDKSNDKPSLASRLYKRAEDSVLDNMGSVGSFIRSKREGLSTFQALGKEIKKSFTKDHYDKEIERVLDKSEREFGERFKVIRELYEKKIKVIDDKVQVNTIQIITIDKRVRDLTKRISTIENSAKTQAKSQKINDRQALINSLQSSNNPKKSLINPAANLTSAIEAAAGIVPFLATLGTAASAVVGAGLAATGIHTIGKANEERDKNLGITPETSQEEIEKRRRAFNAARKRRGYEDLRRDFDESQGIQRGSGVKSAGSTEFQPQIKIEPIVPPKDASPIQTSSNENIEIESTKDITLFTKKEIKLKGEKIYFNAKDVIINGKSIFASGGTLQQKIGGLSAHQQAGLNQQQLDSLPNAAESRRSVDGVQSSPYADKPRTIVGGEFVGQNMPSSTFGAGSSTVGGYSQPRDPLGARGSPGSLPGDVMPYPDRRSSGSSSASSRPGSSSGTYLPPKEALPSDVRVEGDTSKPDALPGQFRMPDRAPITQAQSTGIDRSGFAPQLENSDVKDRLFALTLSEVGRRNPEAQRALMETIFNRNQAHGSGSLMETMNSRYYQPMQNGAYERNLALLRNNPELRTQLEDRLKEVLAGSNDSNFATHNSSAGVAESANRTQSVTTVLGGETFSRKDQAQHDRLHGARTTQLEGDWYQRARQPRSETSEVTSQDPYAGQREAKQAPATVSRESTSITGAEQTQRAYHITGQVNLPAVGEFGESSYRGGTGGAGKGSMPYGVHAISGPRASGPIITNSIGRQTVFHVGTPDSGFQRMADPKTGGSRSEIQIHSARDAQRLLSNGCLAIDPKDHKRFVEHMSALIKQHGSVNLEFMPSPKGQPHQFNIRPATESGGAAKTVLNPDQAIENFRSTGDLDPARPYTGETKRISLADMTTEQRQETIRGLHAEGFGRISMRMNNDGPTIIAKRGDVDFSPRDSRAPFSGPAWFPRELAEIINKRNPQFAGQLDKLIQRRDEATQMLQNLQVQRRDEFSGPRIKAEDLIVSPVDRASQPSPPTKESAPSAPPQPVQQPPEAGKATIEPPVHNPETERASAESNGYGRGGNEADWPEP